MSQTTALVLSIILIAIFVIIFIVSFVINRKTPKPKGCEDILISEENCMGCQIESCAVKQKLDIEKIKEELEEDK
ncbi:MAG: hypothetical protein K6E20_04400 [Acholeplasmatales bacterium]|nr:hypothetical protein [Acholeplasmatales bacterium]